MANSLVYEKTIKGDAIGGAVAAIDYTEPAETGDLDVWITFPQDPSSNPVTSKHTE
jgi:hypothetical protein